MPAFPAAAPSHLATVTPDAFDRISVDQATGFALAFDQSSAGSPAARERLGSVFSDADLAVALYEFPEH